MKYKAVVADIDGTLIAPSGLPAQKPSERLKRAVFACRKKDVVFSLASARSLPWVDKLVDGLELQSPIILDNGAKIYDLKAKKYIWQSFLPKKEAQKILSFLKKDKSLRLVFVDDQERLDDLSKIIKWKISKIVVLHVTEKKAEELHRILKMNHNIHVTRSISGVKPVKESIHITNQKATKQVAVLKLAKFLGISTKEIIGIGDSHNDFPLLMACGLKIAMGNAVPEIKAIADYIAPSYEDEGVVEVLEKFILMKTSKFHDLKGEQKDQLLLLCDKEGNILGQATRQVCHKGNGKIHLAFVAFLFDKNDMIILAKRGKKKSLWASFWDASVVSHVLPGETIEEAVGRRGREELGVDVHFKKLDAFYYFAKHGDRVENEYCFILVGQTDQEIDPNPIEVEEVKKLSLSELKSEVNKNPKSFTPWFKLALEKFDLSEKNN